MNRKILATYGWGKAAEWLELTAPLMMKYAAIHGYDFHTTSEPRYYPKDKHPGWYKISLFKEFLSSDVECPGNYDFMVWLDADVVIKRFDKDIFEDMPKGHGYMGNVVHRTLVHGVVPNCGVWVSDTNSYIYKMEDCMHSGPTHCEQQTYEQGRYCKLLGGDDKFPMSFPNGFPPWFHELPYEWNVTVDDVRGIPDSTRFFHATGSAINDVKLNLIKKWVNK